MTIRPAAPARRIQTPGTLAVAAAPATPARIRRRLTPRTRPPTRPSPLCWFISRSLYVARSGDGVGQLDDEGRSDAGHVLDADRAAVGLHDVLADRQPQPGPAELAPGDERFEQPFGDVRWDARARVEHAQHQRPPVRIRLDAQGAAVGRQRVDGV